MLFANGYCEATIQEARALSEMSFLNGVIV